MADKDVRFFIALLWLLGSTFFLIGATINLWMEVKK